MKGALFDLDGVIFDTESQYSVFWGEQMRMYFPNEVGLENRIKGQTLVQIFDRFFSGMEKTQHDITQRLNEFEHNMSFVYVKGFEAFVQDLRSHGIKTAVVTSSNQAKMENVYRHHPEFISYLKGASYLGTTPEECVGFEDSFNGLKAVKASGMKVVGLYTTNPREDILPYCDVVFPHYENVKYQDILQLFGK